jgi:O-methyltransferase
VVEIGSHRGGGALHLSNANPDRRVWIFDSFEGFANLDPHLDAIFNQTMFKDTSEQAVRQLFEGRGRDVQIVRGFFPASCQDRELGPLSFVHLDVDTYGATADSLRYLESRLLPRSLIVVDDYRRSAAGANKAIDEFTAQSPHWRALPMFPGQALLFHRSWFDQSGAAAGG